MARIPKKLVEAHVELAAVVYAEEHGFMTRKLKWIGRRGAPDRLFIGHGHVLFVEFKKPRKRPSNRPIKIDPLQQKEYDRLVEHGANVFVCDNIEDFHTILARFLPRRRRAY